MQRALRVRQGYTLDRLPIYRRAHTIQTTDNRFYSFANSNKRLRMCTAVSARNI
uniref:Uncharacterized protein n=1 Tax=Anguilla anguilla TaxID=7936 RepID=A0A0E9WMU7_ANGAN